MPFLTLSIPSPAAALSLRDVIWQVLSSRVMLGL